MTYSSSHINTYTQNKNTTKMCYVIAYHVGPAGVFQIRAHLYLQSRKSWLVCYQTRMKIFT